MADLNQILVPELTEAAKQKLGLPPKQYSASVKIPYIGSFEVGDEPYDITDYPEVRKRTLDNVARAIQTRFPLESDKYILTLENLNYADKDYTPQDEKAALLDGKTLGTRLKGDWVLYDKATGKELERKSGNTLVSVPYLTNRGVFIRSGNEYGLKNMFRLRPGMYTRIRGDGIIATHVNPAQGTGRQSNIMLSPSTGIFTWKIGTRNYGVLPLLLDAGVSPEAIRKVWGDELFDKNYKKFQNIIEGSSKREAAEYKELWDDHLSKIRLDKNTTETTLGAPFDKLTGGAALAASNKILRVAQTYTDEETDDRDALQFQTIMGAADYLPERIVRDGGKVFQKILNRIDKDGNLSSVTSGAFQPHVDAVFQEDKHAGYIDGASPIEALDFSTSVSRIGAGGLGTDRAASEESRGVNNSYLGFIDPIRSPESQAVGLQVYMTHGVKKDSRGRLWTKMIPKGNYGRPVYVDMDTVSKGIVATPEYYDPKADPNEFIPAFIRGGDLEYVRRKNVDYYVADSSRMMSDNTGFISGIGALRSNRTMLGSKASSQALSLPMREAPLVQRYLPGDDGEDSTTEAYMGRKLGARFAEANGIITRATEDEVVYRDGNGRIHKIRLYNELPANNQGWLSQRPLVKEGDVIKKGQPIVGSNYTDDKGNAAIGVNLKVAMVSGPNAGTALDAITVSESAAKNKLASEQLYKTRTPVDKETIYDKTKFLKTFDTTEFTKDQLDTIGDDGIVMPGTVLQKGDPMVLAVSLREPGIKGIAKHALTPVIERWEHDYPGTVMDIGHTNRSVSIYTKALTPAKVGDKMCYDPGTEILTGTRGWISITELTLDDTVYTLDPATGIMKLQHPSMLQSYPYSGKMYRLVTPQLDLKVTPNHKNLVDITNDKHHIPDKFELVEVSKLFGRRAVYKKNGIWLAEQSDKPFELPGYVEKCGQHGHGVKNVPSEFKDPETFLPLLGIWLAEGSVYVKGGDFRVMITQKVPEKCVKLEKILDESGYKWHVNGHNYVILDKHLALYLKQFGKSYQKFIPPAVFEYPAELQRKLFDGMMLGDGSTSKSGRPICYTTTSTHLADDFSRLCLNIGYAANTNKTVSVTPSWSEKKQRYIYPRRPSYRVSVVTKKLLPKVHFHNKPNESRHQEYWEEFEGRVYCCTVEEYHTLYVRRNGRPCWSGNSTVFGNKGIIAQILPDNEMLQDENGEPFEVYQSPLGLPSRVNPMVLGSLQLGKIAKATGKPIVWKDFSKEPMADTVMRMLDENGLKESEDLIDPETGKTVPGVATGYLYYLKFKHQGDKKEKARGTGDYTMEDLPLKGGHNSARRFGSMEIGAMFGHAGVGSEIMKDAKLVRGQANHEFWRAVRNGDAVPTPGIPLVHKKFFEHLKAAGVALEDRGNRIHMFAATEPDIEKLTGNREVLTNSTYDAKDLRAVPGGLFDPKIFGDQGDQWAYYQLPEPVLNPLMEKAIVSVLGWKEKDFQDVLNGEKAVDGKTGPRGIHDILKDIDIDKEVARAKSQLKSDALPALKRDKILKRYRALESLRREHKDPTDLFIDRIPILPPKFRPISVMGNDVGIVSDANYLYKAMIDAAEDFKEAKKELPDEMLMDARKDLHTAIKAVIGLVDSPDKKLQEKGVEGVLKWAFGKGSPKFGSLHRKIFGATVDTGGLAVAAPDSKLGIDEIGLPEESAWTSFEPFTIRNLRLQGYSLADAMKAVEDRTPAAKRALEEELSKRPVLVNRAPTLHKYNILAFWPKLTKGTTIRYNPLVSKGFNVDADGDSILNVTRVRISQKTLNDLLTNPACGVSYSSVQPNGKEPAVFDKDTRIATTCIPVPIDTIPVIPETEVKKSDTVTEWDCAPGWYVDTIDPVTGEKVCAEIKKVSKHTGLKMYNVSLSIGGAYKRVVTASEDHSLITLNPDTMELEKTTPADSVRRLVPTVFGSSQNDSEPCLKYIKIGNQVPLSYRLGEFIGAMIGDGWVDVNNNVYMAANCDDIRAHIWNMFIDTEDPLLPVKYSSLDQNISNKGSFGKEEKHKIRIGFSSIIADDLKNLIGSRAENKRIPWQCLCASRTHLAGLLAGLLSTDGSVSCKPCAKKNTTTKVIRYDTVSPYLRDCIQDLCHRLGIRTSVRAYRGPNSVQDCFSITFSCTDMKRFCEKYPKFKLFHEASQKALEQIFADLDDAAVANRKDIVPAPSVLRGEFAFAKDPEAGNWATMVSLMVSRGYVAKDVAIKIAKRFDTIDWSDYKDYSPKGAKHTPEEAKRWADAWCALVRRDDIAWSIIDKVEESSCTEGWDMTIPGPYTFTLWDGTVVQDTMNFHVPVSRKAVQEAIDRMLPSKNLLNPATLRTHVLPVEEFSQGLYIASRPPKGKPIKFPSKEAALQALRAGKITYDTAIEIPN